MYLQQSYMMLLDPSAILREPPASVIDSLRKLDKDTHLGMRTNNDIFTHADTHAHTHTHPYTPICPPTRAQVGSSAALPLQVSCNA
jgi:hypothetical protein